MADLSTGGGDGQDFHYSPFQASWAAGAVYLGAVGVCGALTDGPLWPPLPPQSMAHSLFWGLLLVMPLMVASIGWSYGLTPSELVVRRFDRERFRVPLRELEHSTTTLGLTWLTFASRRVFVVTGPDQDRQRFLRALGERARKAGGDAPSATPLERDDGGLRVPVDLLRFPAWCVACGEPSVGQARLEASHWFGFPVVHGVKIDAPVCAVHRRNERLARWLAGSGVVGLGLAISTAFGLAREGPLWPPGVLVIGAGLGLFLLRVAGFLHLRTWCGWRALGLRTAELSGDLLHLTIHTRSVALRRELLQLRPVK